MYKCTKDKWTIGYGFNLGSGFTKEEAALLLQCRVKTISQQLSKALPYFSLLNEQRKAVLVNMAFNLGATGLMNFKKALSYVEASDYEQAATEMLDSRWAKQVPNWAIALSNQMQTGEWH
ncbi:glycoside hydrolase family protein [Pseudoalteromonas sp. B95]|nr:glycoside hydrolase family protein [Pseudoalteromonas sp. B95]MDK1286305.1 glycoside hydrolase family protein [Pseudoalteromonas sp. B95]